MIKQLKYFFVKNPLRLSSIRTNSIKALLSLFMMAKDKSFLYKGKKHFNLRQLNLTSQIECPQTFFHLGICMREAVHVCRCACVFS